MKRMKIAGLVLSAALMICATTASAALAEEFVYSKAGKLTGKALNEQEFRLGEGSFSGPFTVGCSKALPSGELKEGGIKFYDLPLSVGYGNCKLAGIGSATISTAEYTWLLPPSVQLENVMTIYASNAEGSCKFAIPGDQSLGGNTGEVVYENDSGKIILNSKITGVAYEVVESSYPSLCGQAGEKGTNGRIEGKIEVELEGGVIEVK